MEYDGTETMQQDATQHKLKVIVKGGYKMFSSKHPYFKLKTLITSKIKRQLLLITIPSKIKYIRGGYRAAATSKMECFVIIVNSCKPLTIITKRSILDVGAAVDPPLYIPYFRDRCLVSTTSLANIGVTELFPLHPSLTDTFVVYGKPKQFRIMIHITNFNGKHKAKFCLIFPTSYILFHLDVNVVGKNGVTPLHYATRYMRPEGLFIISPSYKTMNIKQNASKSYFVFFTFTFIPKVYLEPCRLSMMETFLKK